MVSYMRKNTDIARRDLWEPLTIFILPFFTKYIEVNPEKLTTLYYVIYGLLAIGIIVIQILHWVHYQGGEGDLLFVVAVLFGVIGI